MVVRNVVRSPVRAVVQSVFGEGESFHPFQLFTSGAQGAWYDPSDFSTLYQDAAGTTPVTAVEQPVRLMLDRSKGLVLGSELDPGFSAYQTVLTGTWGASGSNYVFTDTVGGQSRPGVQWPSSSLSPGWYEVTIVVAAITGAAQLRMDQLTGTDQLFGVGAHTFRLNAATAGKVRIRLEKLSTAVSDGFSLASVSVRELPGNHALAPNDASRPILRARYNLLTRTEEFDDAVWTKTRATVTANAGVAPDGTTTADTFTEDSTASSTHFLVGPSSGAPSYTTAATVTASIFVKIASGTRNVAIRVAGNNGSAVAIYNPSTGAFVTSTTTGTNWTFVSSSVTALADGWYRITCTGTHTETSGGLQLLCNLVDDSNLSYTGDGTSGIYVWGASLLTAADAAATGNAYQRVGAATDYDTGPPWRPYLAFDGSDDSMSTSSIDFSGTDKMTVFAGVSKLSDAARGAIVELTASAAANNGAFLLAAPNAASATFAFESKGTALTDAVETSIAAPTTAVLTGIGDISGDVTTLRRNGTQRDSDTGDQGTGNYANAALFIGRRNNTSLPLNGRLYGLTVLGRTATAPELTSMESWMASKTGVSL